jgi:hypothetical protein
MNPASSRRRRLLYRILWLVALAQLVAGALVYPVSNAITRAGGVALFVLVWFGLAALCWRLRPVRYFCLVVTLFAAGFIAWPSRIKADADALRHDYVAALRRYDGVPYVWGGESLSGIDCSGLIRRGLIDALFTRGIRTADPALVRSALSLWWNDCSARDLGEARSGLTVPVVEVKNLNEFDPAKILPGDMAVTSNGVHILAFTGDRTWIEADPAADRVLTLTTPDPDCSWFKSNMKIVRWRLLQSGESPLPAAPATSFIANPPIPASTASSKLQRSVTE